MMKVIDLKNRLQSLVNAGINECPVIASVQGKKVTIGVVVSVEVLMDILSIKPHEVGDSKVVLVVADLSTLGETLP